MRWLKGSQKIARAASQLQNPLFGRDQESINSRQLVVVVARWTPAFIFLPVAYPFLLISPRLVIRCITGSPVRRFQLLAGLHRGYLRAQSRFFQRLRHRDPSFAE